jgi:nucleoside-diphosphate-sugar epimerase
MISAISGARAVVIGATGFLGSHLTEQLLRNGAEVLAVGRSANRASAGTTVSQRCCFVACDILNLQELSELLASFRPQKVFHLACHPDAPEGFPHASRCVTVNTLGSMNVFQAAEAAGADRMIFADSAKVPGNTVAPDRILHPSNPMSSYVVSKVAAWQLLRLFSSRSSLEVVGLRSTFIFGPRQNWNLISYVLDCAAKNRPVRLQGGNQTRDPLYITDAVDAFVRAAFCKDATGCSISIGGGHELRVQDMCRTILSLLRSDVSVIPGALPPRPAEVWRCYSDNKHAIRILGWRPKTSFEQGLKTFLGQVGPDCAEPHAPTELGGSRT